MGCSPLVRSYRDLVVWKKAIDLVAEIYNCTRSFPKEETYGLVAQLRRAAVSVPSNIAEGHARVSTGEFRQFLGHALGSVVEIETQILIAERLAYIHSNDSNSLIHHTEEIGKMLNALLRSLSQKDQSHRRYSA
jgi:four helix bundle protein